MAQRSDGLSMVERVAAGDFAPDVLRWLRESFSGYVLTGGAVSMERCMHLPNTPTRVRLAQRDAWLRQAADLTERSNARGAAEVLADELDVFIARGPWRQWRELKEPPAEVSRLRAALFHVARLNEGKALSSKQVARVIGHRLDKTCPPMPPRLRVVPTHTNTHTSPRIQQRSQQA